MALRMGAVAAGEAAMEAVSGQTEKVIWWRNGTSPRPTLKSTLGSASMAPWTSRRLGPELHEAVRA